MSNTLMPQSLVKILVHIVFSTKHRADLIPLNVENELYAYIHGIVKNNESKLMIVNGTANHIHLLISLGKTIQISKLVGDIKRSSSLWLKPYRNDFYWQEGYGAFSIGQSQVRTVFDYIAGQKEKHHASDFKDEFRSLCDKYDVEIDERYVWE